jgi:uncharacterized protein DUF3631
MEILVLLVRDPISTANPSVSALFHAVEKRQPTILLDEIDTVFGPKANGGDKEDVRGLINVGYRPGATVLRCVGEGARLATKEFPVFTPVALAGIGRQPDSVEGRCIPIRLKRRRAGEQIDRFRRRVVEPQASALVQQIVAWVGQKLEALTAATPDMTDELMDALGDRATDC